MNRLRIHLHDEAPRIGSGLRIVTVVVGHKWVRIVDGIGNRAKLPKSIWASIARLGEELPERKRRRKRKS